MADRVRKQPAGQRQLRVGESLKHVIAQTLQRGGFNDPALFDAGAITITEVRISPDLKQATVYAMPLGGRNVEAVIEALNANAYAFQADIGRQVKMKFTPRLTFVEDETFANVDKIDNLLRSVRDSSYEQADEQDEA